MRASDVIIYSAAAEGPGAPLIWFATRPFDAYGDMFLPFPIIAVSSRALMSCLSSHPFTRFLDEAEAIDFLVTRAKKTKRTLPSRGPSARGA